MNEIKTYKHETFGEIRTLTIDNEPWFVGKDVAERLGYAKPQNAIANHVDKEDKTHAPIQGGCSSGKQTTLIINESGLYSLILSSKLPSAKAFKRWITSEVLPSIRKTGQYARPSVDPVQDAENLFRCAGIMAQCLPENKPEVLAILRSVLPQIGTLETAKTEANQQPSVEESQATDVQYPEMETDIIGRPIYPRDGYEEPFNGKKLKQLCKSRKLTFSGIAKKVGCSPASITKWAKGERKPVPYFRQKLCAVFNVPNDYFTP